VARVYLDEDVAHRVARLLAEAGHDAITTRDAGRKGLRDDLQLLAASQDGRVLLTQNEEDFLLLHLAWMSWSQAWHVTPSHSGILLVAQAPPETLADAVEMLLARGLHLTNHFFRWRPFDGWSRLELDGTWTRVP
jgi:hypothetical protein